MIDGVAAPAGPRRPGTGGVDDDLHAAGAVKIKDASELFIGDADAFGCFRSADAFLMSGMVRIGEPKERHAGIVIGDADLQIGVRHPRHLGAGGFGIRRFGAKDFVHARRSALRHTEFRMENSGAGARLEHDRVELVGEGVTLLGKAFVALERGTQLVQTVATLGGALVRNETEARLQGTGVECILNGLYHATGREHVDNLIRVHHTAPGSHSDQFYKGIVDGRAHAVFAGKIIVHKPAQKTDAFQTNNNLLLSDEAEIDTKPELEIYADDVKCSHGATVGDLDPTALFYLRSRGMPLPAAKSLLIYGWAGEVIERMRDDTLRAQARKAVLARLPGGASLDGLE